jgi:hypothetical protein
MATDQPTDQEIDDYLDKDRCVCADPFTETITNEWDKSIDICDNCDRMVGEEYY